MVLIQHHETYQELHGVDKVVIMEKGEHQKLHARLRKEDRCKIPAEELHRISQCARNKGRKRKTMSTTYGKNTVLKETFTYNELTGEPHYFASFIGQHEYHLVYIDEKE